MTKNKTTKGNPAAKRIRAMQDKKLKYFMENRSGEFRMRVIDQKGRKEKITPRNIDKFESEEHDYE